MKIMQRPTELEAWQVKDLCDARVQDLPEVIKQAVTACKVQLGRATITIIDRHMTVVRAESLDWLIKGVGGDFFTCTADAFPIYYQEIK